MLGHKLLQVLSEEFDVFATIRGEFEDFQQYKFFKREKILEKVSAEDISTIEKAFETVKPDVVINAIGIIKQLPSSKDTIRVLKINSIFPHQLAELAGKYGARLITISTDCVFDGEKGFYDEEDFPNAKDLYGKSKNLGEVAEKNCLTIRTSIIGRELGTKHSLVEWFLQNDAKIVKGFENAIYTGFPTVIFARIIGDIIKNHENLEGLYHISSEPINKFDLLHLIREFYKKEIEIEPFEDFVIDRSLDSGKFRRETGFEPQSWRKMIELMAEDTEII